MVFNYISMHIVDEDGGEEVSGELVESGDNAAEVFELAEEALDEIALAVGHRID